MGGWEGGREGGRRGGEGGRSLADIALLPPLVPAFSRWELHREVDIREVSCGALLYSLQVGTSKTLQDCCRIWIRLIFVRKWYGT